MDESLGKCSHGTSVHTWFLHGMSPCTNEKWEELTPKALPVSCPYASPSHWRDTADSVNES